jgi:biopolymer transport protein ExbB/TolQ
MGIMESFKAIGATGKSGFSIVAAGISESLIATAAGIIVAVIAVLFYNFFQTKVNQAAQEFRHRVEDTADLIAKAKKG